MLTYGSSSDESKHVDRMSEVTDGSAPASSTAEACAMGNTSRLDVFAEPVTCLDPPPKSSNSKEEFDIDKMFKENVAPVAQSAILGPGDALFFPPGWWHAMRSESTSFSVSIWF